MPVGDILYKHLFSYNEGKIMYAGHGENGYFLMGTLDTTGKPLAFKSIQHEGSIMRAGTVNNGSIYATYFYFDGSRYREFLLKADSTLNLVLLQRDRKNFTVAAERRTAGIVKRQCILWWISLLSQQQF